MKSFSLAIATLIVALAAANAAAEEFSVYKWVDENGVPQYTDRPPTTAMAERTGIHSARTTSSSVQARKKSLNERIKTQQTRRKEKREDQANADQQRQQTLEQRAANCEQAREREKAYMGSRRLYRPLPNGEREYLSDEELDAARAEARQAVREWCD